MLLVNRRARKSTERGSSHGYFQPRCEGLEAKILMAIDLGGTLPSLNPEHRDGALRNRFAGPAQANTAAAPAFSVADVGDLVERRHVRRFRDRPSHRRSTRHARQRHRTARLPGLRLADRRRRPPHHRLDRQELRRTAHSITRPTTASATWASSPAPTARPDQPDHRLPISTFPFPGIKFVDLTNIQSMLGSSVAGLTSSGSRAILLGAPGRLDASNATPGPAGPT